MDADVQRILEVYRRSGRGLAQVTPRIVDLPNGTRRRGLHHQRGRQDRRQGNPLRRQQPGFVEPPARRHDDDRDEPPELPQEHGRLRSGPARGRSGADPPLLPEERLCRFPHRLQRRAVRPPMPAATSSPSPSKRASSTAIGNVNVEFAHSGRRCRGRVRSGHLDLGRLRLQRGRRREVAPERDHRASARQGYAFAQVRPVGTRDPATRTINLGYVVEEGPRDLHRAHQRARQQPYPRLRDPPRVRARRRATPTTRCSSTAPSAA